ncbi:putative ATPase, V0 complex, c/d subunit, V-type ATP synthase subunit C [Helianthus debilis subsp. tardiflorus]
MTFNIHSGYLEAIVRDQRSGLLTAADYNNLYQCGTLDDIKMHLSATEYGPYLQNGIVLFGFVVFRFLLYITFWRVMKIRMAVKEKEKDEMVLKKKLKLLKGCRRT